MWQYRSRHCTLTPPSLIPSPLSSLGLTSLNQPRPSGLHCWGRGICSGQDSSPISKQCPSQVEEENSPHTPTPGRFFLGKSVLGDYSQKWVGHSGLHCADPLCTSCTEPWVDWGSQTPEERGGDSNDEGLLYTRDVPSCPVSW